MGTLRGTAALLAQFKPVNVRVERMDHGSAAHERGAGGANDGDGDEEGWLF